MSRPMSRPVNPPRNRPTNRQRGLLVLAACLAWVVLALASCQSAPQDRQAASGSEEDLLKLDAVELQLLDLRLTPDPAGLASVRAELQRSADRVGANRLYAAAGFQPKVRYGNWQQP